MLPSNPTVLVVDDDEVISGLLQEVLEDEGYRVQRVGDGNHAVDRILTGQLDAILLDLRVPSVDGLQILKLVRSAESEAISGLPIMLLSALASDAERQAGLAAGADDYLAKPFDLDVLVDRLQHLVQPRFTDYMPTRAAESRAV